MMQLSVGSGATAVRSHAQPRVAARVVTKRQSVRTHAEDEKQKGVVPGLNQWPPKAITEHGEPKPEDDPKNYEVISGKRTGGPSESEVEKAKQKEVNDLPFSKEQKGGPQLVSRLEEVEKAVHLNHGGFDKLFSVAISKVRRSVAMAIAHLAVREEGH